MEIKIPHKLFNTYWWMQDNEPMRGRLTSIQVHISKPDKSNPKSIHEVYRTKTEIFLEFEEADEALPSKSVFKTKKALLASL